LQDVGSMVLAFILIGLGVLFLADQYFHIDLAGYIWPFGVIIPGVVMFIVSLNLASPEGEGFAAGGSVITMLGLVLLVQNLTGLWATWAYAWALVAPSAVGLGFMLYGTLKGREKMVHEGVNVAKIGLTLFLCFGAFFELVIGISGLGISRLGWPLLLIALGIWILARQVMPRRRTF
jgi:hypothetical protein